MSRRSIRLILGLCLVGIANAFVTPHRGQLTPTRIRLLTSSTSLPHPTLLPSQPTATSLNAAARDLPVTEDSALIVGFFMIIAATVPYVIGLFFPSVMEKLFFVPIYKSKTMQDVKEARDAEIYWKLMYATLGVCLTILNFAETVGTDRDPEQILKDSYILWSIFYTGAAVKLRLEATREKIVSVNRTLIQIWHSLVVIVLWLSVAESKGLVVFFNAIF